MSDPALVLSKEPQLADWTRAIKPSALQEMLSAASRPNIISFALGLPAMELFPKNELAQAATQVLANDPRALQYSPPFQPLKNHVVSLMAQRGVVCKQEQVFLTAGAQQGMNLLARLLLNQGGQVITEATIYTGFQQVIEPFQPEVLTVETEPQTGMDVEAVERLLKDGARPAFIYSITDGHNPFGVSMSIEKRNRLVQMARHYQVPIMEDDPYGFLHYGDEPLPPLRAMEEDWVFYVGSFSKVLAPALRVGWMIVPEALIPKLSIIKEASDIDTTTFTQRTISAYLDTGSIGDRLSMLRRENGMRRDTMLRALREQFPASARWNVPTSGLFIWVELPNEIDTGELLKSAIEKEQVAFIPGHAFSIGGSRHLAHCMRLNFSNSSPERIEEGIARLGRALKEAYS
jgi:2-aminoadipate transaminase